MKATGISTENDKATGKFNLTIHGAARDVTAMFEPIAIPTVAAAMLTWVMERGDPAIAKEMQMYALSDIHAKRFPGTGQPYLEYRFENGLGFGSGLELDKLKRLHRQLSELLATTPDDAQPARFQ